MKKSDSIKEIAIALNKAQSEMGGAIKGSNNPFFKSKYADLSSVVQAIKQPFANAGLSYVQFPIESSGRIGIETILMHTSGEYISNEFTVQLTKQDAQSAGSALTYCRRYALQAIAGIPSEDDDGNGAVKQGASNQNKQAAVDDNIIAAIDCLDVNWVKNNWSGVIAKEWPKLNNKQTEILNNLINQQG